VPASMTSRCSSASSQVSWKTPATCSVLPSVCSTRRPRGGASRKLTTAARDGLSCLPPTYFSAYTRSLVIIYSLQHDPLHFLGSPSTADRPPSANTTDPGEGVDRLFGVIRQFALRPFQSFSRVKAMPFRVRRPLLLCSDSRLPSPPISAVQSALISHLEPHLTAPWRTIWGLSAKLECPVVTASAVPTNPGFADDRLDSPYPGCSLPTCRSDRFSGTTRHSYKYPYANQILKHRCRPATTVV